MKDQKKAALITGANRGIGFETAKQLGEKGIAIIVAARQLTGAKEALKIQPMKELAKKGKVTAFWTCTE